MRNSLRAAAIALALCGAPDVAAAQETGAPAQDPNPAAVPDLKLSQAQKQTIYLSISNQQQKETAPPTFNAAAGVIVPLSVELQPLPKTIIELIPEVKDYHYAMVANQVLLVDPRNRQVVEVITQ